MSLVGQWQVIQRGLPEDWGDARLRLTITDRGKCNRAAALLGPAQPYRAEPCMLRFYSARGGGAPGPDGIARLLRLLDRERIRGELELISADAAPPPPLVHRTTLAESWGAALGTLPSDWSDLYGEVELLSTDYIDRAALLMAPMNPRREGGKPALRFRSARRAGYGASAEMVRRCLERCDAESIRGEVRVLRMLSHTDNVGTQGPVWYVAGRVV